jgi:uncharacterized membrane protein YkvA (DUF1232 family)
MSGGWRAWARRARLEVHALGLACRDPRTPWAARLVAACVVAYALSPIDLIPDPIPVLGYLDDLVLVPIGIALARRLVPADVLAECRARAAAADTAGWGRRAAAVIVVAWSVAALAAGWLALRWLGGT